MHIIKSILLSGVVLFLVVNFIFHLRSLCAEMNAVSVEGNMKYYEKVHIGQYTYDQNSSLIFLGGMPRSGITLTRVMLDVHPDIRCSAETHIISDLLLRHYALYLSEIESTRLHEAGITKEVFDSAIAAFMLEFVANFGETAPLLCNSDAFTLMHSSYLSNLFPNSKFLLMVRDGRAVAHSIITNKISIPNMNIKSYKEALHHWNAIVEEMDDQCRNIGSHRCLKVHYEQLVLNPRILMRKIFHFLNVSWSDAVLHHENFIGNGEIKLLRLDKLTGQIFKPVNAESLDKWVGHVPNDVMTDLEHIAPMLSTLGYDTNSSLLQS